MENPDNEKIYVTDEMLYVEEEKPQRVEQNRFKSWAVWLSVLGALWTIASAFGLPDKWGITEGTFRTVVDAIGVILIGFGILNDPTNKAHF